jgi:UDP-N-acetylglucosamine/UDP-N-acetylgalactosamine diphosphorylase
MRAAGTEFISYFQVDNPLVSVADPFFLGLHCLEQAEISSRMLPKTGPGEKLGNFCVAAGQTRIIEYSDMPADLAETRQPNGTLRFIAGSPAIHILSRGFVEKLTSAGRLDLPWHRADKKVPCLAPDGTAINPEVQNAVKLETFIFDALPLATKTMVLEADRAEEFAPVKNRCGVDSMESCQRLLIARDAAWLEAAGIPVPRRPDDGTPACTLELSPRRFIEPEDVREQHRRQPLPFPQPGQECYYP